MVFAVELEREDDGRWLAEIPTLAGVMAYGADRDEAVARVQALARRVIAERYARAYATNPGIDREFPRWGDEAAWPGD